MIKKTEYIKPINNKEILNLWLKIIFVTAVIFRIWFYIATESAMTNFKICCIC